MSFYQTYAWRKLSHDVKTRDRFQCQCCASCAGEPYVVLNTHHIVPHGGPDDENNLITLCDTCHAVVTCRWHKPHFPLATFAEREAMRVEYEWFLRLPKERRDEVQRDLWRQFGVTRAA
jgi:5-methylcytosine-specific restriction endonuclease McrA